MSRGTKCLAGRPCQTCSEESFAHNLPKAAERWATVQVAKISINGRVNGQDLDLVARYDVLQASCPEVAISTTSPSTEQVQYPNRGLPIFNHNRHV